MAIKIMLRNVRLSYEHIFTPNAFDQSQQAKYSATLIIPKDHPDLPALKRAMVEAGQESFPRDFGGSEWPRGYTCSLKDADKETNGSGELLAERHPEYKGCYILEANSTNAPAVVDRRKQRVVAANDLIYAGCYVNVSLAAKGYTYGSVKKGVKCYLNGVQYYGPGERFGADATNDFDVLPDLEEDDTPWL